MRSIGHLTATIEVVEKDMIAEPDPVPLGQSYQDQVFTEFPIGKLRNLTQLQAVIAIARHNGGIVKAQDAKRLHDRGESNEGNQELNKHHAQRDYSQHDV